MKQHKRVLFHGLVVLTAILAVGSLLRVLTKDSPGRGYDFHCFWYSGHFVWQRIDPYKASLEGLAPRLPVYYLDGKVVTQSPVAQSGWGAMATNTAPLQLLISILSRLSWPIAFRIWTAINLLLIALVVQQIASLMDHSLLSNKGLLLLFLLCSLIATRQVIELGQTSLVVLAFLLTSLMLGEQHQGFAGICLGIALSKYSLTFPGILYFLYRRWYKGLGVGILIQLLGLVVIACIGNTTPWDVASEYIKIMLLHASGEAGGEGFHLVGSLQRSIGFLASLIAILFSISLLLVLLYWYRTYHRAQHPTCSNERVTAMVLLVITMQWNLLTVFHHRHDHIAEILFLALITLWTSPSDDRFILSPKQRFGLWAFAALAACVWSLPLYQVLTTTLYIALFNLCSIAALGISLWLLFRIRPIECVEYQSSEAMHS